MMLGDLGADVIKVERPIKGDDTRSWGPPFASNNNNKEEQKQSAYFLGVNRNKKSITVDFKQKEGKQIIYDLVKQSDVFIENYLPGKLDEAGLGYEVLKAINPGIIYVSITGRCIHTHIQTDMHAYMHVYNISS